jgi:hypothetical protein
MEMAPLLTIHQAGRAKRYRDKKAGKEIGPPLRTLFAQRARAVAEQANVSVRTVNRLLARERQKVVRAAMEQHPEATDEELARIITAIALQRFL